MKSVYEINADSVVGPNHNYAGLSYGNIASVEHFHKSANPKQAALQGLAKMKYLHDMGVKQFVFPFHPRPNLTLLRHCGFKGTIPQIIENTLKKAPLLLAVAYSASSMWMANAATISPSTDTADGLVHFTPANLLTYLHRSQEAVIHEKLLKFVFSNPNYFSHHPPLLLHEYFKDEGAANHNRLCKRHKNTGINVWVYGTSFTKKLLQPQHYPARQSLESLQTIARLHGLNDENVVYIQQNPLAIDQGIFHNDVIATANENVFIFHEQAWVNTPHVLQNLIKKSDFDLRLFAINEKELTIKEAVKSYLFNSQLITKSNGKMHFIAPIECEENKNAHAVLQRLLATINEVDSIHYINCRQSMWNGGGPACLRLRIVLNEEELSAIHPDIFFTDTLYEKLETLVKTHYRDMLKGDDLADPQLVGECQTAWYEIQKILNLPVEWAEEAGW